MRPAARQEVKGNGRKSRFEISSAKFAAKVGVSLDGVITTGARYSAATVIPPEIASGKIQGGITTPTPSDR